MREANDRGYECVLVEDPHGILDFISFSQQGLVKRFLMCICICGCICIYIMIIIRIVIVIIIIVIIIIVIIIVIIIIMIIITTIIITIINVLYTLELAGRHSSPHGVVVLHHHWNWPMGQDATASYIPKFKAGLIL